ncbi:MAG: DUF4132 domain-containing protein [Myxococcales bacterium]|nr:DUF4132 domain-containing protein [Myxococcales bacterium]
MSELHFVDAVDGYQVAMSGGEIICRNAKGKELASLPKKVRESEVVQDLREIKDVLVEHERECRETVDAWMTRSLPVPRDIIAAVWPDPTWCKLLENAVVWAIGDDGAPDRERVGFLRGADSRKGVGVVDLDGETAWLEATRVAFPHPVLLGKELDDFRELATELSLSQGLEQLYRETFRIAKDADLEETSVDTFSGGEFEMLTHATNRAKNLGFRVSGGYAVCPVWEGGTRLEARFWIGAEYPDMETETGELCWVGEDESALALAQVTPVAYSEGTRMASMIYAGRVVEKREEEEEG